LFECTLQIFLLDPIERVPRYLCREQNLESWGAWPNSYVDTPAIKPTEVTNQQKFAYCKRNAWKVSMVLISKCLEPFAGIGYNWNECLVMKKWYRCVITMKLWG
jgi:hypothetical protein